MEQTGSPNESRRDFRNRERKLVTPLRTEPTFPNPKQRSHSQRQLPRECVLILTPIGRDSSNAAMVLEQAKLTTATCTDLDSLCIDITEDTGVLLIAEEALTSEMTPQLIETLSRQPKWSDIPIVILTSGGETSETSIRVMNLFTKSGNVTMLERPIRALTLISAIRVALRARRRQWEIANLISERDRLLNEAREAREEAENANRMKDQFLATLSHELRTPLNAILGWSQLLLSDGLPPEDHRLGAETIDRNARTQAQLIEDLLDVSRIISGKLRLDMQPVNLGDVVDSAIAAVQTAADAKGVTLRYEAASKLQRVNGDPARLQQICWNLLSNAVKFTPRSGEVVIRTSIEGSEAKIEVSDNGDGIEKEFLPYVFDRFRQADGSTTRRQGGLGLGLSIVKQLVELHGGTVRVESEGKGKGSVFTVSLPVRQVATNAVEKQADAGKERPVTTQKRVNLDGLNVLLVDDEQDARELLRRVLSDHKAIVRVASSVTEALNEIDHQKPDIVVSDISMPDRDGFDLIHELRTDGHAAENIPAIALTAFARDEDREKILGAGFQAHVAKPVNTTELASILADIVARRPSNAAHN